MFDWLAIFAEFGLFFFAGSISVFEACVAHGRSPRGGVRFLFAGFALDGVVAILAFWILKVSLVRDFWGEPLSIYLAAFVWGQALLKVKLELLVPLSPRIQDVLATFSTVRSGLLDRLDKNASLALAVWVEAVALPAMDAKGYEKVADLAKSYFRSLVRMSADEKRDLISRVDSIDHELASSEMRRSNLAWLLIDNGGKGILRRLVTNAKEATN